MRVNGASFLFYVFFLSYGSDRLNLPSVLVLNSCGITCAGDEREIAAFCAHVSELDLSDNKLEDWHEVKLVRHSLGKDIGHRYVLACVLHCCIWGKALVMVMFLLVFLYILLTLVLTWDSLAL